MLQSETVRKYDTYKDSGIEWIGKIPSNKNLLQNKYFLKYIKGKNPEQLNSECKGVPYVGASELDNLSGTVEYENYTEQLELPQCTNSNVLVLWDGARAGLIGKNHCGAISSTIIKLEPNLDKINENYLFYYLKGFEKFLYDRVNGTTIPHMNRDYIEEIKWIDFTIDEQQQIADYLDKKCGEIDRVVETEKSVIEKLKEYKQSIITVTVTKGLDKTVPLKDSGIEWIGKIPQHWDVLSLARIANIVRGASPRPAGDPMYFCGNFCPWITVAEVTKDDSKYIFETEEYLTELGVQHSKLIDENTFLLSNSGATLGVPKITKIKGCINDGSLAFLDISCNMDYLYYVLKSRTNEFRKQMQGYGQPNLNTTIVKAFKICLPSTNDQIQIAEYLDKKCSEIDKAIGDKQQVIEKFTEYKKSLIYECVTGKRKVVA